MAAENPVATSQNYIYVMNAIFSDLLKFAPENTYKKSDPLQSRSKGIFGTTVAYFHVTETQKRKSLHSHGLVWGGLSPRLLEAVAHNKALSNVASDVLNSAVHSELPLEVFQELKASKVQKDLEELNSKMDIARVTVNSSSDNQGGEALTIPPILRPHPLTAQSILERSIEVNKSSNTHFKHSFTCIKAKSAGCRLGYPQGNNEGTGPVQLVYEDTTDKEGKTKQKVVVMHDPNNPSQNLIDQPSVQSILQYSTIGDLQQPLPIGDMRVICWETSRKEINCTDLNPTNTVRRNSNGYVVTFSPALSSAICSNTAVYPLGSAEQAKSVCFYLVKYITKDAVEPGNVLLTTKTTYDKIKKFPSIAIDTGTPERTAIHFWQSLLNSVNGGMEVAATQATAILLGMDSYSCSHEFSFLFASAAVNFVKDILQEEQFQKEQETERKNVETTHSSTSKDRKRKDLSQLSATESLLTSSSSQRIEGLDLTDKLLNSLHLGERLEMDYESFLDEVEDSEENLVSSIQRARQRDIELAYYGLTETKEDDTRSPSESPERLMKGYGSSKEMVEELLLHNSDEEEEDNYESCEEELEHAYDKDAGRLHFNQSTSQFITINQNYHYSHRGERLEEYCLYEYVGLIKIVKIKEGSDPDREGASRKASRTIPFDPRHVQYKTHTQQVKSKLTVPQLVGRPPAYPKVLKESPNSRSIANKFALYILTLFSPWDLELKRPSGILDWSKFCSFVRHLARDEASFADKSKLAIILNMSEGLHGNTLNTKKKKMITLYRNRAVKPWNQVPRDELPEDYLVRDPSSSSAFLEENANEEESAEAIANLLRAVAAISDKRPASLMAATTKEANTKCYLIRSVESLAGLYKSSHIREELEQMKFTQVSSKSSTHRSVSSTVSGKFLLNGYAIFDHSSWFISFG
jgi:hypothetical protein